MIFESQGLSPVWAKVGDTRSKPGAREPICGLPGCPKVNTGAGQLVFLKKYAGPFNLFKGFA